MAYPELESRLSNLALQPPGVILLEGGDEKGRLDLAIYWAKTANCPKALALAAKGLPAEPCLQCPTCLQLGKLEHLDLWLYDGRISNREDEENPGPVKALRIENVRDLKSVINVRPHGPGKRVAVIWGMGQTREEALNSLLKTLEEPGDYTLFALLAPQRMQLLPTLVSRSHCITLPWPHSGDKQEDAEWDDAFVEFAASGRGLLDKAAAKGNLDSAKAAEILLKCQRSLARISGGLASQRLDKILLPLAKQPAAFYQTSRWLAEAQEMLVYNVSAPRVLEAFATKLFSVLKSVS